MDSFDPPQSILTEIAISISFAKLSTLHHSIVSVQRLDSWLQTLLRLTTMLFSDNMKYPQWNRFVRKIDWFLFCVYLVYIQIPLITITSIQSPHIILPKLFHEVGTYVKMSNDWFQYDAKFMSISESDLPTSPKKVFSPFLKLKKKPSIVEWLL